MISLALTLKTSPPIEFPLCRPAPEHGVSGGCVGADALALVQRKQRNADGGYLGDCSAYYLALLVGYQVFQVKHL